MPKLSKAEQKVVEDNRAAVREKKNKLRLKKAKRLNNKEVK